MYFYILKGLNIYLQMTLLILTNPAFCDDGSYDLSDIHVS